MLAARLVSSQPLKVLPAGPLQQQSHSIKSTRWVHQQSQKSSRPSDASPKHTNPGEMPAFSFKDLGATPAVKGVVYVMLVVIGTAETITYGQWAYRRWWKGDNGAVEKASVDE